MVLLIIVFSILAVTLPANLGIGLIAALESKAGILASIAGVVALTWAGVNCWRAARNVRACRNEIKALKSAIFQWIEEEITEEEATLRNQLALLDTRLDELVRLYEESIASEDEVVEFCNSRLTELQELVAATLGIHPDDILDERSAEIWAPSFLQAQSLPEPVLRDAAQSEREIREWTDDIISSMREALPKEEQWRAFRKRILPMLGLDQAGTGIQQPDNIPDCQSTSLNALRAVRCSTERQTYLAGHYFYQKIVCAEDLIGLFRAYVNVLNRRVPHTFALQILYEDITAIGLETAYNRDRFDMSGMTIDQHTHTLTLELSSGSSYRMSGDAGSAGQIETGDDLGVKRVMSQANQAFRDQIINIRALIREAKASRNSSPIYDKLN